jgi:hypothetical protein
MKCNSCGAENSSTSSNFSCNYCGAENVIKSYFEEKSNNIIDSKNIAPLKNEGIKNYNAKKFISACNNLDKYLASNPSDSEAWVFSALSEAETLKASNFNEKFITITDAINNAKNHEHDEEFVNNSEITLSAQIISNANDVADVYFKNSIKRFKGFGGGSSQAVDSIEIINIALNFPNHKSMARINLLFYALQITRIYNKRYSNDFNPHLNSYIKQLEEVYKHEPSKKVIDEKLLNLSTGEYEFLKSSSKVLIQKVIKKKQQSNSDNSSADTSAGSKKLKWFVLGCLILCFFYYY